METTIVFTPAQLVAFIGAVCGFIASIGAAVAIIAKFITKIKAPEQEQNRRIKVLEEENKEIKAELKLLKECRKTDKQNENERFNEIEKADRVILQALQALLADSLGADATKALHDAKEELDKYLREK